ncbi:hypothetical protein MMF93_17725 [Streptomyces tubbatahanensis]|uniref:Integral membrane protein n=1 Tax=Streptomyces tubbatahanensis TaxID=2923272 RepID=A0ABY3XUP2_9ACTN|nr:hypothetical protein [Streptomyces tubbatahanensis]UNS98095.1 hypothetical protein MMF93_17725 [Streptomyces tubbatahanensis]
MVPLALRAAASWPARRWGVAAAAAALTALVVGVPTAAIPTPLFSRAVATPWWAWPTLALTALLAGLLLATYVRAPASAASAEEAATRWSSTRRSSTRLGTVGGALSFFAVGCPVCNKLVLLALGTSGALTVWQPLQPVLALASLTLLAVATVRRLAGEAACPVAPAA